MQTFASTAASFDGAADMYDALSQYAASATNLSVGGSNGVEAVMAVAMSAGNIKEWLAGQGQGQGQQEYVEALLQQVCVCVYGWVGV